MAMTPEQLRAKANVKAASKTLAEKAGAVKAARAAYDMAVAADLAAHAEARRLGVI